VVFSQSDGLGIGEGTALKIVCSTFVQMYIRITNVQLLPSALLLPNRCYQLPFFSVVFVRCHFVSVLLRWLGGSFAFFYWLCAVAKKQMCHQKRWHYFNLLNSNNLSLNSLIRSDNVSPLSGICFIGLEISRRSSLDLIAIRP